MHFFRDHGPLLCEGRHTYETQADTTVNQELQLSFHVTLRLVRHGEIQFIRRRYCTSLIYSLTTVLFETKETKTDIFKKYPA